MEFCISEVGGTRLLHNSLKVRKSGFIYSAKMKGYRVWFLKVRVVICNLKGAGISWSDDLLELANVQITRFGWFRHTQARILLWPRPSTGHNVMRPFRPNSARLLPFPFPPGLRAVCTLSYDLARTMSSSPPRAGPVRGESPSKGRRGLVFPLGPCRVPIIVPCSSSIVNTRNEFLIIAQVFFNHVQN